ncbi:MAG: hypothetical protein ACRECT_07780 [Thermoplasmata archaeon]
MNRPGRLGQYFPLPFVSATLLLVALILLTPVLYANGQPAAGSVLSQAELVIDALPGNSSTHFYVHGLSTTARYAEIRMGFVTDFNWTGAFPGGPLNWTNWTNGTSVLSVTNEIGRGPVAVNVTALYSANGVNAYYVGLVAVDLGTPPGSSTDTLTVVSGTSGIAGFSTAVTNLPVPIPLVDVGSGGGP